MKKSSSNFLKQPKCHLFEEVAALIADPRRKVVATVNLTMVHTYFEIGRMIVEEEQEGK